MSTSNVILGALAGLAIGAIAGILFAPGKGSASRRQMMDKRDDYVERQISKLEGISDVVTGRIFSNKSDGTKDTANLKYDITEDIRNFARQTH
jgi:gas vesicle protein